MMFFTHLSLAHYFYTSQRHLATNFKLSYLDFMYGNVQPDITEAVRLAHRTESTWLIFQQQMNKVSDPTLTSRERSLALGIATHYASDYFCRYHALEPYKSGSLFMHFIYELMLHFRSFHILASSHKLRAHTSKLLLKPMLWSKDHLNKELQTMITRYEQDSKLGNYDLEYAVLAGTLLLNHYCLNPSGEYYENSHLYRYLFAPDQRGDQYA